MTEPTRRALLGAGVSGLVLAPFLRVSAADAAVARSRPALYSRERFRPLRRQRFQLVGPDGRWSVRLTKVRNLSHASRGDDHSFSLTFRCAKAGPPQGTYTLRRPGFEATPLFMVPIDPRRRSYEAVIFRKP